MKITSETDRLAWKRMERKYIVMLFGGLIVGGTFGILFQTDPDYISVAGDGIQLICSICGKLNVWIYIKMVYIITLSIPVIVSCIGMWKMFDVYQDVKQEKGTWNKKTEESYMIFKMGLLLLAVGITTFSIQVHYYHPFKAIERLIVPDPTPIFISFLTGLFLFAALVCVIFSLIFGYRYENHRSENRKPLE